MTRSSDTDANMRAAEAGYEVTNPRAMSRREREIMASKGGLESARKHFGREPESPTPAPSTSTARRDFTAWVIQIGNMLGLQPTVTYVEAPDATFIAQ